MSVCDVSTCVQVNSPDRIWVQPTEYPEHDLDTLSVAMAASGLLPLSKEEVS